MDYIKREDALGVLDTALSMSVYMRANPDLYFILTSLRNKILNLPDNEVDYCDDYPDTALEDKSREWMIKFIQYLVHERNELKDTIAKLQQAIGSEGTKKICSFGEQPSNDSCASEDATSEEWEEVPKDQWDALYHRIINEGKLHARSVLSSKSSFCVRCLYSRNEVLYKFDICDGEIISMFVK